MLKDEERIAEVKRRIAKKEQQQRLRRRRIVSAVCIAACFAVIVGVSFAMPGIIGRIEPSTSSGFETAATILGGSTALGYMVIGLLAFILGACVTILCFRIHQLNKEEQTEKQKEDKGDGADQYPFSIRCYPVGLLHEWYSVSERSKTDIFPADLLLRLLCPWLSLLDAVSASVF